MLTANFGTGGWTVFDGRGEIVDQMNGGGKHKYPSFLIVLDGQIKLHCYQLCADDFPHIAPSMIPEALRNDMGRWAPSHVEGFVQIREAQPGSPIKIEVWDVPHAGIPYPQIVHRYTGPTVMFAGPV